MDGIQMIEGDNPHNAETYGRLKEWLARGGVLPRDVVAEDVKALDQESRSVLRRHGVRFGQFTIFLPLLLKPAPTFASPPQKSAPRPR
jgi:hypothetical protein